MLRTCCRVALGATLALGALPARADGIRADGADGASADAASAAAASAAAARADADSAASEPPSRFGYRAPQHAHRIAVGTGVLLWLSSRDQGLTDLGDESGVHSDPQLSVAFGSQLAPTWVIGLRLAYAVKPYYSDVADHALWQLGAEARWQPEGELGPYAVAGAGGVAAVDDSGGIAAWHLAPAVGGALGFDVALSGPVTLGFELRALGAVFREEDESFGAEQAEPNVEYGLSTWLGLNVIATLGVGEGMLAGGE